MIWFQHFHKCAGTFFVELALKNGFTAFAENKNGNPYQNGKEIPLWDFSEKQLEEWIANLDEVSTKIICTEFGYPNPEPIIANPETRFATIIRDPWERAKSNYIYDVKCAFTSANSFKNWQGSSGAFTRSNYYARTLSKKRSSTDPISSSAAIVAQENLRKFTHIFIQEDEDLNAKICKFFDAKTSSAIGKTNSSAPPIIFPMVYLALKRKWYKNALNALLFPIRKESFENTKKEFAIENRYDYEIYRNAVRLAN